MSLIKDSDRRRTYYELDKIIVENKDKLFEILSDEQKEYYYSITHSIVEQCNILMEEYYEEGFILASKMMERLLADEKKETSQKFLP